MMISYIHKLIISISSNQKGAWSEINHLPFFLLLLLLVPLVSANVYADDLYADCDFDVNRLDESDLRNDPVFGVFLEKYPDAAFSFHLAESLPPWFDAQFRSSTDDGTPAILTVTTRGCIDDKFYRLILPSVDKFFHLDTTYPHGPPSGQTLYSITEITDEVHDLVFSEGRFGDNICDKQLWMNLRSELVCIKESSVNTLLERGYLIVDDLIKELNT